MYQLILVLHVFAAACIVGLVLVQQGKGATMGAGYGSGASQTVFGSRGSGSFLLRITVGFLVLFFSTSLGLNFMASRASQEAIQVVLPVAPQTTPADVPVTPSSIPSNSAPGQ